MAWEHSFKKGEKINEGGMDMLRGRFERQRVEAGDLVATLRSLREKQADFITDTRAIQMVPVPAEQGKDMPPVFEADRYHEEQPRVAVVPKTDSEEWYQKLGPLAVNNHAHSQIAADLGIPAPYYRKMLADKPELLAVNVNEWWHDGGGARKMVRAQINDEGPIAMGFARAVMSSKYQRMDYLSVADEMMKVFLDDRSGWIVTECGVTDLKLHIEARFPTLEAEIAVGDIVCVAVKITTSEVGAGALAANVGFYRLSCSNTAIVPDWSHRQVHLGKAQDELVELLSAKTVRMDERVRILKMRDVVKNMANPERFQKLVANLRDSSAAQLNDPIGAAELLSKNVGLAGFEAKAVQSNLVREGLPSIWGLANALTATARGVDFERKADMEAAAGKLLSDAKGWQAYQEAKAEVA